MPPCEKTVYTLTLLEYGERDGLKAQKQLAQGNALGKRVTRYAPRRGKSKRNAMKVKRFCPYRTLETLRIHLREMRWANCFWAFSPS